MTNHVDQYIYWRDALAGRMPPISANDPQPGRYKLRKGKGGPWQPVAIFYQAGDLKAAVGREFVSPHDIWTWCADKPVSEADYKSALDTGRWPGEIGHNSGDLSLAEEIEERASQALEWLAKNGIKTKTDSDMAANYRSSLTALEKRAKEEKAEKKAPHIKAEDRIEAEYKPLIDSARRAIDTLRDENGKWMKREEDAENARRKAAYEAEQAAIKAKWLAEAAERAKKLEQDPIAALTDPEPKLPDLPPPPAPAKIKSGGQVGKSSGLKTVTTYSVVDHAKALAFFADNKDVKELIHKLATKASKAGVSVPGVERREERVAS